MTFNYDRFRSSTKIVCVIDDPGGCILGAGLHNRDLRQQFGLDWMPSEPEIKHDGLYYLTAKCWGDGETTALCVTDDDDTDYDILQNEPYEKYLRILAGTSFIIYNRGSFRLLL